MKGVINNAPLNLLLVTLPESERQHLLIILKPVALQLRRVLYQPEEEPPYVHFLALTICAALTLWDQEEYAAGYRAATPDIPGPALSSIGCSQVLHLR